MKLLIIIFPKKLKSKLKCPCVNGWENFKENQNDALIQKNFSLLNFSHTGIKKLG